METVRNLKHTGHTALACPKCGSLKVKQSGSLSGWLTPAVYSCGECGYAGVLVIELDEDPALKERAKKGAD